MPNCLFPALVPGDLDGSTLCACSFQTETCPVSTAGALYPVYPGLVHNTAKINQIESKFKFNLDLFQLKIQSQFSDRDVCPVSVSTGGAPYLVYPGVMHIAAKIY